MAIVRLFRPDRPRYKLPPVCMRCGAEAAHYKRKQFSWFPPWVSVTILAGLLPYVIIAAVLTKRMSVEVPLCDRHRYHWGGRIAFTILSLLGLGALGVGTLVILASMGKQADNIGGLVCLGWAVLFVVWLIGLVILQSTAIRPSEITDDQISLKGVSEEFVATAEEYEDSLPRSRRRDDDDDEEWERPRRRVADDDRERYDRDRYERDPRGRRQEPPDERFE
jgi:hypothetical protein